MTDWMTEREWSHKGIKCLAMFSSYGSRCGYVCVPKSHNAYGVNYMNLDIDVHGGLTFSDFGGHGHFKGKKNWWIGFDCAHYDDAKDLNHPFVSDLAKKIYSEYSFYSYGTIKTLDYVVAECESLVNQLLEEQ